ncbi:Acyl-CoA-binding domain-containing protein 1 [Actinomortierella ambigua]|nr:Acyl-CoA-binding domain-containing protein 1 [Actinomortierella ambigua]
MPSAQFEAAAERVQAFTTKPNNDELLEIYALYKQATVGDNTTARPGVFDLKGKAKWDAWAAKKGISQEDAEAQYIALVEKLAATYA